MADNKLQCKMILAENVNDAEIKLAAWLDEMSDKVDITNLTQNMDATTSSYSTTLRILITIIYRDKV